MATPEPKTTIGILSIGDMGGGIARLLVAKGFRVVTDVTGRSADTVSRAQSAGVECVSLSTIVSEAAAILSIVPPADARSTAEAVLSAVLSSPRTSPNPLTFADLNAISPSSARCLASLFSPHPFLVRFIDGAIIGGPPSPPSSSSSSSSGGEWSVPQIPISGPHPGLLPASLSSALQTYTVSADVGAASGLKMCFASLTKGYTAIAVQAFATAHRLGVLSHLQRSVEQTIPAAKARLERAVAGMPPKAYRWVREMEEIADTHRDGGGWGEVEGADMFTGAARIYGFVADGTVLGREKVGKRVRGLTVEDVASAVADGLEEVEGGLGTGKRRRVDGEGEDEREADKPNPMKRMWEEDNAGQEPGL